MYPAHRELSGLAVVDLVLVMGLGMGLVVGMVGLVQGMVGLVMVMVLPCYNRDLQVDMVRLVMGLVMGLLHYSRDLQADMRLVMVMVMGLVRFHSHLVK